ncbi:MAG: PorP/SprF family type IX secretion system membrane protein [Bacteroidota bacterium]|nr:PorP/SprF family type IX secretion system membrane protein [Bacteroidota bacterium]
MRKILYFFIIILVASTTNSKAQEIKNYNLYSQNPILYNPAHTVNDYFISSYINSHLQWVGLNGAPRNYDFGGTVGFFPNMGVGVSIASSTRGLVNNLYSNIKYGYRLRFGEAHHLKMGVSFGIANDRLLAENAEYADLSDPNLHAKYYNKTVFSSGFGLAYRYQNFDVEFSVPQLYEYNQLNFHFVGTTGYKLPVNSNFAIKPSVMVRGTTPGLLQFDGNITAIWRDALAAQIGYRSNTSFVFSLGYNAGNYFIGYAYQANSSPISTSSSGSHEIQLIFNLKREKKQEIIKNTELYGHVKSAYDNSPVQAEIKIFDSGTLKQTIASNPNAGSYITELKSDNKYTLKVQAQGYESRVSEVSLTKNLAGKEKSFLMQPVQAVFFGTIINKLNQKPLQAEVLVLEGNKILYTIQSKKDGTFSTKLDKHKGYTFKIKKQNYTSISTGIAVNNENKLSQEFKLSTVHTLSGQITDSYSGKPVIARLDITNTQTGESLQEINSNTNGEYSLEVSPATKYTITAGAQDYFFQTVGIEIPQKSTTFNFKKDIELQPMGIGAKIVLNNVNFDFGKWDLRPESYTEINRLVAVMKNYPHIKVEISGHTDNKGSNTRNEDLSLKRADAVIFYIVAQGINNGRLKPAGYGSGKPRATNSTENGRQLNRRVEAEIIE